MRHSLLFLLIIAFISCQEETEPDNTSGTDNFTIPVGTSFDWDLGEISETQNYDATVIDVDAFSTTKEQIARWHSQGKTVIAYVSVGSVENFRPDKDDFPDIIIGEVYEGFEDEKWLDIRNIDLLGPIMESRFDMIREKGFDGIEPDNINGFVNPTGFPLTEADAIQFCRWLIDQAHQRGMSIGQKNAEELVPILVNEFDWMLTEDAFADNWQDLALPYIQAGKAVFVTEYTDQMTENEFYENVCPESQDSQFYAILKDRDLTEPAVTCQ